MGILRRMFGVERAVAWVPVPLTSRDAFWHAATGTPYQPIYVPQRIGSDIPSITPLSDGESFLVPVDAWRQRTTDPFKGYGA